MDAIVDQLILGRFLADPGRLLADSGRSWQLPNGLNFYTKNHPKLTDIGAKICKNLAQVDEKSIKMSKNQLKSAKTDRPIKKRRKILNRSLI